MPLPFAPPLTNEERGQIFVALLGVQGCDDPEVGELNRMVVRRLLNSGQLDFANLARFFRSLVMGEGL